MKEKKDCKECGAPLEDWQIKQGYDLCLECYKSKRKTSHELLKDKSTEEEEVENELGEDDSDKNQGEEEEIEDDEEE